MIVKNFDQLAKTKEREFILEMIDAGLGAIDTKKVIERAVQVSENGIEIGNEKFDAESIERLFVVGVGKCSLAAAEKLEDILGEKISGGVVVDVRAGELDKIRTISGDHPMPTQTNVDATKEVIELLSDATKRDLVIFIVSGGGSTLLCQPENMTCLDEAEILKCMFGEGIGIKEINTVRKHISKARGGFLAKYAYPARAVSLIFSDVPGDDLEFIASGPTIKDTTTVEDAKKVIEKCGLETKAGIDEEALIETPKDDKYFKSVKNILLVSNKIALAAMAERAKSEGFHADIHTTTLSGEARDVGDEIIKELHKAGDKSVLLYGGETTVTVEHEGKGGRSLELALSALKDIQKTEVLAAFASDGRDNTDFAGAIVDEFTKEKAEKKGLSADECLEKNCSYRFFGEVEDYIKTGNTGRNVSDFVIALKKE